MVPIQVGLENVRGRSLASRSTCGCSATSSFLSASTLSRHAAFLLEASRMRCRRTCRGSAQVVGAKQLELGAALRACNVTVHGLQGETSGMRIVEGLAYRLRVHMLPHLVAGSRVFGG